MLNQRVNRFSTIRKWIRSVKYLRSRQDYYDGLRSSRSLEEVQLWAVRHPLVGFNKDSIRAVIIESLAKAHRATVFVETGTYHGATALCACRYLCLPVYSCEISFKRFALSKLVTIGERNVRISWDSSTDFIRRLVGRRLVEGRPLFYLDAHWEQHLPLVDEIALITQMKQFAVIIDDFSVPSIEDFGHDNYNELPLGTDLIRDTLLSGGISKCYFPNYSPSIETGLRRGYCVFWRSDELEEVFSERSSCFPLNLLTAYDLAKSTRSVIMPKARIDETRQKDKIGSRSKRLIQE